MMRKFTFAFLVLLLFFQAGCGKRSDLPYILLNQSGLQEKHTPQSEQNELRVAIACTTSVCESIISYDALMHELEKYLGMPVKIIPRKTYGELKYLMSEDTIHLAFISPYSYLLGNEEFGLELLAAPVLENGLPHSSYIIVHRDSFIDSFEALRNKSFAFTDPDSVLGRLYPLYLLKNMGETPESFFSHYIFSYSSDNSIRAVADYLVHGAAVDSLVYDYLISRNPEKLKDLVVIGQSPPFCTNPIVTKPGLNAELKEKLSTFFLTLHQTEEGRRILSELKFERFVFQEKSAFDDVKAMADAVFR